MYRIYVEKMTLTFFGARQDWSWCMMIPVMLLTNRLKMKDSIRGDNLHKTLILMHAKNDL